MTGLDYCGESAMPVPSRFHRQRFAMRVPVPETGRCSHADWVRAEERGELERQGRWRWTAEELGDPLR